MSTPTPRPPSAKRGPSDPTATAPTGNPTRQLLDELDALMQRMLALPVNQLEDDLRKAAPEGRHAETEAVGTDPDREQTPHAEQRPAEALPHPEANAKRSPPKKEEERALKASPEVLEAIGRPRTPDRPPASEATGGVAFRRVVGAPTPVAPGPPEVPLLVRPLVWGNRVFDTWTRLLGPPGRWLRGSAGRCLLGWIGLGLLAGAAAWVALNEFGWTW